MSPQPRSRVQETSIADAILAEAEAIDAIVVGSHGLTGIKSLVLGSVSHAVIQHTDRPGHRRASCAHQSSATGTSMSGSSWRPIIQDGACQSVAELATRGDTQLGEYLIKVRADRSVREEKPLTDLLV